MKHEQNDQIAASTILERIQLEYEDLLRSNPLSLEALFSPEDFHFDEFFKSFNPHSQSDELKELVQVYAERQAIWTANAKHHITCALFLYPTASFERMNTMMKNLVLGFYLNDTMGRDIFKTLTPAQQRDSRRIIENMAGLGQDLTIEPGAHPLEIANAEILREFRENSPTDWFRRFLTCYSHHLDVTHQDGNADTKGHIPDVHEYMDLRCHYAGVHHIMLWIEYSGAQFLDWGQLRVMGVAQKMERLNWVTAAFEALSNDLFSFEKEVIDCDADSNLVMVIAMNKPRQSLRESIFQACDIVRSLLLESLELMGIIRKEAVRMMSADPALSATLHTHLDGIARCVKAGWTWHCYSKRYKRPVSLWMETTLVDEPMISAT